MAEKYVKLNDIIDTLEHEWGYEGMREDLDKLPTADVEEVKHGEWLEHEVMFYDGDFRSEYPKKGYKCSECGRVMWVKEPYCNCGAKMDGKE